MEFRETGGKAHDFILVDDKIDWAVIPGGTLDGFNVDLPIRLQVGNPAFGKQHIINRHSPWLDKHQKSVEEMLFEKLGSPGQVWTTEEDDKIKIMMSLAPDAVLVLKLINTKKDSFFSVTTIYHKRGSVDGSRIGRYISSFRTL